MSRKAQLDEMANLEGNSVAHRVLYGDDAGLREADLYQDQATKTSETHTWNEDDIDYFRTKAQGRAARELKRREEDWDGRTYESLEAEAFRLIEVFIQAQMR
ncbi:MAG: hypothetical protein HY023_17035 [Chloroflexi bacterium]|nr:hypothetical protein [Chloroflexota bacterium]MBI3761048.1 hypothetical protein [Chloroflexota bacterium]